MKIPCGGFFVGDDFEFEGKTLHLSESAKAWTKDHRELENKDAHNQHPIHSITNLSHSLEELQEQIDAISSSSDVVDVVGTYADLQLYDTTALSNNDIIKVLEDEENENAVSYYRWGASDSSWGYIGSQSPYFTKAEVEEMFDDIDPQLLPTLTEEEDNGKYAQFVNGEWTARHIEFGEIIHAETSTSLNGDAIPKLTEAQLQTAYNSFIAGKSVAITSVDGKKYYAVVGADSSDADDIKLTMLYADKYLITYNHLGAVAQFKDILQGQVVVLSREYGTAQNDHGYYREWSPNPQGKVWVECGVFITTVALSVGSRVPLPVTFEDENFHVQVTVLELGSYNAVAYRSGSRNAINVQTHDYYGAPKAVKICVEAKGWKALN